MNISKKIIDFSIVVSFLVFVSLPVVLTVMGINPGGISEENRKTSSIPSLQFRYSAAENLKGNLKHIYIAIFNFINEFDDFLNTTFSLRSELLQVHNAIKVNFFRTDPIPAKVVEGINGWYFPGDSYSNVIKELKGLLNFSVEELKVLQAVLTDRNKRLSKRNIKFYLAVAPDKLSVYGNFLPIKRSQKKTKLQQLLHLAEGKFTVIDLKEKFTKKDSIQLFLKTDTHWNDYGAYLAYQSLIQNISIDFPGLSALKLEDFIIDTVVTYQQDLTKMLSINSREENMRFTFNKQSESTFINTKELPIPKNYKLLPAIYEKRYKNKDNELKVLIFRDSFTANLEKYLKETFGECLFIWQQNFNFDIIESEKPDIVLQIIVERDLDLLIKKNW